MAPECATFSQAFNRFPAKRIRSHEFPTGLPNLTAENYAKAQRGNTFAYHCSLVAQACDVAGVPWMIEDPASSYFWMQPCIQALMRCNFAADSTFDYCQYGAPWRKTTRIRSGNIHPDDLSRLCRRCSGRSICSRTHRRHIRLSGRDPAGIPWTKRAEPYPAKLCRDIAFTLSSQIRCKKYKM